MPNIFSSPFDTSYHVPPFDKIKLKDFIPAIKEGLKVQKAEIKSIITNAAPPTFANTVEALEHSGAILKRATSVMYNLSYAHTNPELQTIIQKITPTLSKHNDQMYMDLKLFKRINILWEIKKTLKLTKEQERLLESYYKAFAKNGAKLSTQHKKRVSEINQRLSLLSLQFGQNILATINEYKLVIDSEYDLKGLPQDLISAARETAISIDMPTKWVFTLHNASVIPFLQYADNRALRQQIWTAYSNKGNNGDHLDNNAIVIEIVALRKEKATLLGYPSHAHYVLEDQMSKTPDQVSSLLNKLWTPALTIAEKEAKELQELIDAEGNTYTLAPWDWRYYAEKWRNIKFELDETQLKPYFLLSNVQSGMFEVAQKLYDITFEKLNHLPIYHHEVQTYLVRDADKKEIGILYLDYFPRESKQGGAWMTSYVPQQKIKKERVLPVISIVCNFTKPTGDTPSLLTYDEVNTFFHEFGHALHGLLSDVTYVSLAGTNVPTDFVELPSQIMENWCSEPNVLKSYALHYLTGAPIPDALISKLQMSQTYGQGFATVEYLSASLLDMAYHTSEVDIEDISSFESKICSQLDMPDSIISRYKSTYFSHIFAGGYSAGYYSYIWSEVLDADAFSAFKNVNIFDKALSSSFRKNILARGGSEDPMKLYVKFMGRKPKIDALLAKRGLVA